jgi:hypothetical protein
LMHQSPDHFSQLGTASHQRSVFLDIGGYRQAYYPSDDYDLGLVSGRPQHDQLDTVRLTTLWIRGACGVCSLASTPRSFIVKYG